MLFNENVNEVKKVMLKDFMKTRLWMLYIFSCEILYLTV